jgi:hypothetical protein
LATQSGRPSGTALADATIAAELERILKSYDYDKEFAVAFQRTAAFGMTVPAMPSLTEGRLFARQQDNRLAAILRFALRGLSPHDLMAQCFAIHEGIAPEIDRAYGVRSVLTLGWVHDPPNDYFRVSDEELMVYMRDGIADGKMNLHCWLTLPTREILDCTLPTTVAIINNMPEAAEGLVMSKHWRELAGGLRYHPLLVGSEFLERTGAMVHIPY